MYPLEQVKDVGDEVELEAGRLLPGEQQVDGALEERTCLIDMSGQQADPPQQKLGVRIESAPVIGDETANTMCQTQRGGQVAADVRRDRGVGQDLGGLGRMLALRQCGGLEQQLPCS